jgi:hypothetical protein
VGQEDLTVVAESFLKSHPHGLPLYVTSKLIQIQATEHINNCDGAYSTEKLLHWMTWLSMQQFSPHLETEAGTAAFHKTQEEILEVAMQKLLQAGMNIGAAEMFIFLDKAADHVSPSSAAGDSNPKLYDKLCVILTILQPENSKKLANDIVREAMASILKADADSEASDILPRFLTSELGVQQSTEFQKRLAATELEAAQVQTYLELCSRLMTLNAEPCLSRLKDLLEEVEVPAHGAEATSVKEVFQQFMDLLAESFLIHENELSEGLLKAVEFVFKTETLSCKYDPDMALGNILVHLPLLLGIASLLNQVKKAKSFE